MAMAGKASLAGLAAGLSNEAVEPPTPAAIHDAVVTLYEGTREPLCRYLLCLGVTRSEADELCQDAFLRLFAALRSGQRIANPRAWVFAVAHNAGLDIRTGGASREVPGDGLEAPSGGRNPEQAVLDSERRIRLRQAVRALPAHQRHCLNLRAEGLRYREIADILGVTVSVVAGSLKRAVERIREDIRG